MGVERGRQLTDQLLRLGHPQSRRLISGPLSEGSARLISKKKQHLCIKANRHRMGIFEDEIKRILRNTGFQGKGPGRHDPRKAQMGPCARQRQIPQWVQAGGLPRPSRLPCKFIHMPGEPVIGTLGSWRAEMQALWSRLMREGGLEGTHPKMSNSLDSHWLKQSMWETSFPSLPGPLFLLGLLFQSSVTTCHLLQLCFS